MLTGAVKSGIVLTQGELVLNQNVTIRSAGNQQIMISGGGNSRVFEVAAGANVTLDNLDITDGNSVADNPDGTSQDDGNGGGILNFGRLTVRDSTLSDNSAFNVGGGIDNEEGIVSVIASTLSGNSAIEGGGIFNGTTATVSASTLSQNSATRQGGGIYNASETLTANDSTVNRNNAPVGADLYLAGGVLINNNSTIADSFS